MNQGGDEGSGAGSYASPPCFMHELDPVYTGLPAEVDTQQASDVMRWRKAERERLIAARLEVGADERRCRSKP